MLLFRETVFEPLVRSVVLFVIGVLMAFAGVYLVDKQSEPVAQHEPPLVAGDGLLRVSFQSLEVRNYMCGLRI
jgi:hypothetical protein